MKRPTAMRAGVLLAMVTSQITGLAAGAEAERYEFTQAHMGVPFTLIFYAADESTANRAATAAFARIKQLNSIMSDYDSESELSRLSRTSGSGQKVSVGNDLWTVLYRSDELSRKSEGAFDVTVGPIVRLWRKARRSKTMPDGDQIAAVQGAVGYTNIRFDKRGKTVELMRPKMRLDLGGIAKGYAASEALKTLSEQGVSQALVAGSGDIAIGDAPPDAESWRVGIAPLGDKQPPSRFLLLNNASVSTSGDASQFVEIDGKRYSHIVDPRTGIGLTVSTSVTIVAPEGTTADGFATAVCVLGPERGLKLVEATCGLAALIVRREGEQIVSYESKRMKELRQEIK